MERTIPFGEGTIISRFQFYCDAPDDMESEEVKSMATAINQGWKVSGCRPSTEHEVRKAGMPPTKLRPFR